jgi:hypothetical protein
MDVGSRLLTVSSLAVVVLVVVHVRPSSAQAPLPISTLEIERSPLVTDDRTLQASLERLSARSSIWRDALGLVHQTGRRALVVTPDRVRMIDPKNGEAQPFDPHQLAETIPLHDHQSRVDVVVVVVNLRLLRDLHWARGPFLDLERDLDRILAHEIYAHAVPYLLAGTMSGQCADPRPGERAAESCAIRRENEIRSELGLGTRTEYGLDSLALRHNSRRDLFR